MIVVVRKDWSVLTLVEGVLGCVIVICARAPIKRTARAVTTARTIPLHCFPVAILAVIHLQLFD